MVRLLTPILVFILMVPLGLRAQLDPVSLALRAHQDKNYTKAQELIEIALADDSYKNLSKTWYFRGYIYKELYKENRTSPAGHEYRFTSIESFLKTIELDNPSAPEFSEDCKQSLKYLGSTLYNDAAVALDTNNFDVSQDYYDRYKLLIKKINPEIDFTARDIEYKLYKASKKSIIFDASQPGAEQDALSGQIIVLYEEVLQLDSNNISGNYNLGIHYYNQGVNIIENMDYDLPFEDLFRIQEQVMELFQKALPYMKRAYRLDPTRKTTVQALSGIYFGLNDIEKSEYYQKEYERLNGN